MARQRKSQSRSKKVPAFQHEGHPSVFTCPDCSGTLFIVRQGNLVRFQCRIGHLYSPESMMEAQSENVERSLWTATRALEEQSEYILNMAQQIAKVDDPGQAKEYETRSRIAMQKAQQVRKLLTHDGKLGII